MNELAKTESAGRSVVVKAKGVDQMLAERQVLLDVMERLMSKDKHYGTIPGTPKPTLYKPGSELILSAFRIAVIPLVEDLSTEDEIRYRVTCRGVHMETGIVVGEGVGEASTSEERYKWRRAKSDKEFNYVPETHRRIKFENDGGETFQVRTNPADLANTVLKMSKKRAQIDMTLTATAASDIFTQDLEDLPTGLDPDALADDKSSRGKPKTSAPQPRSGGGGSSGGSSGGAKCSQAQVGLMGARCRDHNVSQADVIAHFGVGSLEDIPKAKVNDVLAYIQEKSNA